MRYTFLIRGVDGSKASWSCAGQLTAETIDNALLLAREQTFRDLMGSGRGPYKVTQINVEEMV